MKIYSIALFLILPFLLVGQKQSYNCESETAFMIFDTTSNADKIIVLHQLKKETKPDTLFWAYKRTEQTFFDCACNDSIVTIQKTYGIDRTYSTTFITFKKDENHKSKWKWSQQYVRELDLFDEDTNTGLPKRKVISSPKLLAVELISYTEIERDVATQKVVKTIDYEVRLKQCNDPIFHPEKGFEIVKELERN